MSKIFTLSVWLLVVANNLKAQCVAPVPEPPAACSGTLLTEGVSVNTGENYYYDGTAATFSSISLNGGTIRICGNLSILNMNFNSGNLIIEPSGVFSFGQSITTYLQPNQLITNYGVLNINQSYNLNTNSYLLNYGVINLNTPLLAVSNAIIVNDAQAQLNMTGNDISLNCLFINKGEATFQSMTINSGGGICMSNGSSVIVQNITNNATNSISVESGTACFSYSGQALLNGTLTASSNLIVCRLAGSQDPSPPNFGAAQVNYPCTSCDVVLPVELISFSVAIRNDQYLLQWETGLEDNLKMFSIETSSDGQRFQPSVQILANGSPSNYQYPFQLNTKTFFRLRMIDLDGRFTYSKIIVADPAINRSELTIIPNPVTSSLLEIRITSAESQQGALRILDFNGRVLISRNLALQRGSLYYTIPVSGLASGLYYVIFHNNKIALRTTFSLLK